MQTLQIWTEAVKPVLEDWIQRHHNGWHRFSGVRS